MDTLRDMRRLRRRVRIGAPDPALTPVSGLAAVTELVDRLGMIKLLDAAIGPIKTRDRGLSGGELLVGLATAQLAGEDFLVGLDRRRADVAGQVLAPVPGLGSTTAAGQVLAPVPGLGSTTAAGLARKFTDGQWHAVETGIGGSGLSRPFPASHPRTAATSCSGPYCPPCSDARAAPGPIRGGRPRRRSHCPRFSCRQGQGADERLLVAEGTPRMIPGGGGGRMYP